MSRPTDSSQDESKQKPKLETHTQLLLGFNEYLDCLIGESRLKSTKISPTSNITTLLRNVESGIINVRKFTNSINLQSPIQVKMQRGTHHEQLEEERKLGVQAVSDVSARGRFVTIYDDHQQPKNDKISLIEDAIANTTIYIMSLTRKLDELSLQDQILVMNLLQKVFRHNPILESRLGDSQDWDLNNYLQNTNKPVFPLALIGRNSSIDRVLGVNPLLVNDAFKVANKDYLDGDGKIILQEGATLFQDYLYVKDAHKTLKSFLLHLDNSDLLAVKAKLLYGKEECEESIIDSIIYLAEERDDLRSDLIDILKEHHLPFLKEYASHAQDDFLISELNMILIQPSGQVNADEFEKLQISQREH
jgi:hypothetical protein